MDSYGLSETLNQQENLTNEDEAKNQFLQESINDAMTKYNLKTRQDQKDYKDEGEREEQQAIGGFGSELTDAGAKVKGLKDAIAGGYKGFHNLSAAASKVKSTAQSGIDSIKSTLSGATPDPEEMSQSARNSATQQEATQSGQNEGAGQAGEAEAGSGEGTGAADTGTAGKTAGATGEAAEGGEAAEEVSGAAGEAAEETAGSTIGKVAGVVGEGVSRVAGGAIGAGNLGFDIYKQVEGGGFLKGGVNTGDDIGNITNEAGSTIDIIGAATGDPLLMAAGVGVGLIGSAISGISELFHHHEDKPKPPPPPPKKVIAPVAVQSLAAEGDIGQGESQSSLAAVQVGAS